MTLSIVVTCNADKDGDLSYQMEFSPKLDNTADFPNIQRVKEFDAINDVACAIRSLINERSKTRY